MKKAYVFLCLLAVLLALHPAKAKAGTYFVGLKSWYETTWDSALLDIYDQNINDDLPSIGFYDVESDTYVGTGYLAGPLFGYQTNDKLWSFSFAPMVVSDFSQEIRGAALYDIDIGSIFGFPGLYMPVTASTKTVVDVTRRDYDLAVSYSLSQFKENYSFFKYCKAYLGLKYQEIDYDFHLTTKVGNLSPLTDTVSFDYQVYVPTLGGGFVYPFTEEIVGGIQVGLGMAHFEGIDVDDSIAYTFEASINISPAESVIVQIGYRYQQFSYDLHTNDGRNFSAVDKTRGPTLSLVNAF